MSAFRLLLYGLLLVVAGYATHLAWQTRDRSPESFLRAAEEHMEAEEPAYDLAVLALNRALERARTLGDLTRAQEALYQRGKVQATRGLPELALADCRAAIQEFGPRPDILEFATRTALGSKEPEEALAYAQRLREAAPENEIGPDLLGRTYMVLADLELSGMRTLLGEALPGVLSRQTFQLARLAAVLDPGDPARRVTLERIRAVVGSESLNVDVLSRVDKAGLSLRLGREAFLDSLKVRASPPAMEAFLDLYLRADAVPQAAALARLAASQKRFQGGDGTVLLRTAQALLRLDRKDEAKRLVKTGNRPQYHKLRLYELRGWCPVLLEIGLWHELRTAGKRYVREAKGLTQLQSEANFFLGQGLLENETWDEAATALRKYGRATGAEIYPGARIEAWMGVAQASRELELESEERRALSAVARLSAKLPCDVEQAPALADAWMRRMQAQRELGQFGPAQTSLSHVMRFAPERLPKLMPQWHRLAQRNRDKGGRVLLTEEGRPVNARPDPAGGPEELLWYAEYCLEPAEEEPDPALAAIYANRILRPFPGFLPALDVLGRAHLLSGDEGRAADALMRQLEIEGPNEKLDARLNSIDTSAMSGALRVRWARRDPAGVLLAPFVDQLFEAGRPELALAALTRGRSRKPTAAVRLRTARLVAAGANWKEAQAELVHLTPEDPELGANAGLLIEAALRSAVPPSSGAKELRRVIAKLAQTPEITDPQLPEVVNRLILARHLPAALAVLDVVEKHPNLWGEELVIRRAVVALLSADTSACSLALARAEALGDGGAAEIGELLLAGSQGQWARVARFARRRLAALDPPRNPALAGLFAALGGDFPIALMHLGEAEPEGTIPDPLNKLALAAVEAQLGRLEVPASDAPELKQLEHMLQRELLLGNPAAPRDPRTVLLWILAARRPDWSLWFEDRARSLPKRLLLSPWVLTLRARALYSAGDAASATVLLQRLTKVTPSAWLLLEEIAVTKAQGTHNPELLATRSKRVRFFGSAGLDAVEIELLGAFEAKRDGHPEKSSQILRETLAAARDDPRALAALADDARRAKRFGEALDTYQHLLEVADSAALQKHLPYYLEVVSQSARRGLFSVAAHSAALESLKIQFPDDPTIARELTLLALDTPGGGFRAAWRNFEAFREEHSDQSIEGLRAGEAARWLDVYLEYDPTRAVAFIESELELDPTRLATWAMYVESLGAVGRREEALTLCQDLLQVVPAPELLLRQARLLVDMERDPELVRDALARISRASSPKGGAAADAEILYLEARARIRQKKKDQRWAVATLEQLWEDRVENEETVDPVELARQLAAALLVQGPSRDPKKALTVLSEAAALSTDSFETDFLRAYRRVVELGMDTQAK